MTPSQKYDFFEDRAILRLDAAHAPFNPDEFAANLAEAQVWATLANAASADGDSR